MEPTYTDPKTARRISEVSRSWLAFAVLCAARFMVMLDLSIVALALPAMQSAFRVTASATQWVLSIYALTFGALLTLAGKAGDLFGRRRMLIIGFVLFSVASLLGGLAPSLLLLVIARAIQGVGAAMISPVAFAVVTTLFADEKRRGRSIAIWSALSGITLPIGGLLGGLLVAGPGWRWVMFVNAPVGVAAAVLAPVLVHRDTTLREKQNLDASGALTATLALLGLIWVLGEGDANGWTSVTTIAVALSTVVMFVAFVRIERRSENPIVELGLLRDRSVLGANLSLLLAFPGLVASVFTLSFFLQHNLDLTPFDSGLAFLPMSVVFVVATNASPRLANRFGARLLVVVGSSAMAVGFICFSLMRPGTGGMVAYWWCGSLLMGMMGLAVPMIFTIAVSRSATQHRGVASGLLNTSQQIGAAMGLAAVALIESRAGAVAPAVHQTLGTITRAGVHNGFLASAAFVASGALVALFLIRPKGAAN